MKKKIGSILLVALMVVALVLPLYACNSDGDGDGNNNIENLDILALSLGRLENADLNFQFDVGESIVKTQSASSAGASTASEAVSAASGDIVCSFSPSDMVTNQIDYDPFYDDQTMMDNMSTNAREIVDELVANITVLNTPIYKYGTFYYLSYDSANDVVSATIYKDSVAQQNAPQENNSDNGGYNGVIGGSNVSSNTSTDPTGTIIKIYYDENGNETTQYTQYDNGYNGTRVVTYLEYTKGVKYTIINATIGDGEDESNINYTCAQKINGKWSAVKMWGIDFDNYVFDEDKAVEEYGGISIDLFQEADGTSFYYNDRLQRDANNNLLLKNDQFQAPGIAYTYYNGIANIQINLCLLEGWSEYQINVTSDETVGKTDTKYTFGNDVGDYIVLENGSTFTADDLCSAGYYISGIDAKVITDATDYSTNKEYWVLEGWDYTWSDDSDFLIEKKDSDLGGRINDIFSMIDDLANYKSTHVRSDITFSVLGNTAYQQFVSLSMLFEKYGFDWNSDRFDDNFMDFLCEVIRDESVYENQIFANMLGCDYTAVNVKTFAYQLDEMIKDMNDTFISTTIGYRDIQSLAYDSLPARPDNIGLINLSSNISGSATVSQSGIDFSQISVDVAKNILLAQGKQYTVLTYFVSGGNTVIIDAFNVASYANASFTLEGKSSVELPNIEADGEYKLCACLAKVDGESYVRLSEVVEIDVNNFASFNLTADGEGGEYNYTYSCTNSKLSVLSKFDDVQAPTVTIASDVTYIADTDSDGVYEIYFTTSNPLTIEEVLEKISVVDNRDGVMAISNLHFVKDSDQMPVAQGYVFENGENYTLVVKDSASNETSVKFVATCLD